MKKIFTLGFVTYCKKRNACGTSITPVEHRAGLDTLYSQVAERATPSTEWPPALSHPNRLKWERESGELAGLLTHLFNTDRAQLQQTLSESSTCNVSRRVMIAQWVLTSPGMCKSLCEDEHIGENLVSELLEIYVSCEGMPDKKTVLHEGFNADMLRKMDSEGKGMLIDVITAPLKREGNEAHNLEPEDTILHVAGRYGCADVMACLFNDASLSLLSPEQHRSVTGMVPQVTF